MSLTGLDGYLVETRGIVSELGAHVTGCAFDRAGTQAALALGDGTVRLTALDVTGGSQTIQAHDGGVLALAADAGPTGFVSGGDDGRFVRVRADGAIQDIAAYGGKWVEQAATSWDGRSGVVACAAGKFVHLTSAEGGALKSLEHPSTVTGIAFDGRGKRLATSHYNGASLWFVNSSTATPKRLDWKGSHTGVALHPAAEAVVTAMQENALHGWRLPDGHNMRMSGYPSKPESLAFTRSGRYLASGGADAIVVWPFFGGGPMGKPPLELAQMEGAACTRVACHPVDEVVAAGFTDGSVVLAEIATKRVVRVLEAGHGAVSALAWSGTGGWLLFGTETGFSALVDFRSRT